MVFPEEPGQTGAVGAGALHSHLPDRAMLVEPPQQRPVSRRCRRELGIGEAASDLVDRRSVMGIPVSVYTAGDLADVRGRAGHVLPSADPMRSARTGPVEADKTVMRPSRRLLRSRAPSGVAQLAGDAAGFAGRLLRPHDTLLVEEAVHHVHGLNSA